MARPRLHVDFEGFSDVNLRTAGADVYSRRAVPTLMGVQLDDGEVELFDYAENFNAGIDDFGDFDPECAPECPDIIREAFRDGWDIAAHNWFFEDCMFRNSPALARWPKPRIDRWICTQAKARYWGLPDSLEKVGRILNLDTQKDKRGSALIQKLCVPQKLGARSKQKFIRRIDTNSQDWQDFRRYNIFDVKTEYAVDCALPDIPEKHARGFYVDARMNIRGFGVDLPAVAEARKLYTHFYGEMEKRFKALTKGLKPGQVAKVREFVNDYLGSDTELPNLRSATIRDALLEIELPEEIRELLEIRSEAAKASVKKLDAFEARTADDSRARGGFMWYGAHTGRWSGKGIQPQNFPRGIEVANLVQPFFSLLADLCLGTAELVYHNPLTVLAAALRGFIVADPGKLLVVADYAQIELRVLAWLAGEEELLETLRNGVDPYSNFAGKYMYNRDPATIGKKSLERQIAKSALLGAQYQIWIDAFIEYCKTTAGIKISREQATLAILSYREAHPEIVDFWGEIEKAAIFTVEERGEASLNNLRLKFEVHDGREWLRIYLPSGRPISYFEPQVRMRETTHEKKDRFTGELLFNEDGTPQTYTKKKKVLSFLTEFQGKTIREYTYGGKLTENVVQGTSADIMSVGLENAEKAGFDPIMTVHDEGVTEVDDPGTDEARMALVHQLEGLFCDLPPCYDGLPIAAEGFFCHRYRKG